MEDNKERHDKRRDHRKEGNPNYGKSKYNEFDISDPYYQAFLTSIRSEATRTVWTNYLNNYMKFHSIKKYSDLIGTTPETLENPNVATNIKLIQSKLVSYINAKKGKGIRSQSLGNQMTALRHFYWINEVDNIKWDRVRSFLGEAVRSVEDKAYTHEQIAKILEHADLRLRVVILVQSSTGMRIGAIPGLKWGDLNLIEKYGIYAFKVYRGTPAEYLTFCTPECAHSIKQYFDYRERMGEEINEKSPLLREQFSEMDANDPIPSHIRSIYSLVRRGFERAGMRKRQPDRKTTKKKNIAVFDNASIEGKTHSSSNKRYDNMMTHGFRKFAKKQMRKAGIDAINIEYLVGHKGGDLKMGISRLMMVYDPSEETELLHDYLKAVNNLTIDEQYRLKIALDQEQQKREEEKKRNDSLMAELDDIKKMIRESRANHQENLR